MVFLLLFDSGLPTLLSYIKNSPDLQETSIAGVKKNEEEDSIMMKFTSLVTIHSNLKIVMDGEGIMELSDDNNATVFMEQHNLTFIGMGGKSIVVREMLLWFQSVLNTTISPLFYLTHKSLSSAEKFRQLRLVEESMIKYLQLSPKFINFSLKAVSVLHFNQQVRTDVDRILLDCSNLLRSRLNYDVQAAVVLVGCQIHKISFVRNFDVECCSLLTLVPILHRNNESNKNMFDELTVYLTTSTGDVVPLRISIIYIAPGIRIAYLSKTLQSNITSEMIKLLESLEDLHHLPKDHAAILLNTSKLSKRIESLATRLKSKKILSCANQIAKIWAAKREELKVLRLEKDIEDTKSHIVQMFELTRRLSDMKQKESANPIQQYVVKTLKEKLSEYLEFQLTPRPLNPVVMRDVEKSAGLIYFVVIQRDGVLYRLDNKTVLSRNNNWSQSKILTCYGEKELNTISSSKQKIFEHITGVLTKLCEEEASCFSETTDKYILTSAMFYIDTTTQLSSKVVKFPAKAKTASVIPHFQLKTTKNGRPTLGKSGQPSHQVYHVVCLHYPSVPQHIINQQCSRLVASSYNTRHTAAVV